MKPLVPEEVSKAFRILDPKTVKRVYYLIAIAVIAAVLESMNVVVVFQMIRVISNPDLLNTMPIVGNIELIRDANNLGSLMIIASVTLGALFFFKNVFLAYATFVQKKFMTEVSSNLARDLLRRYLLTPYDKIFHRNSAELINNIINLPSAVASRVIMPVIEIFSELVIVFGIVIVLLLTEPMVTIFITVILSCVMGSFYMLTRKYFQRWGADQVELLQEMIRTVQESLGGNKVIRVIQKEKYFLDRFTLHRLRLAKVDRNSMTVVAMPRLITEVLIIWSIACVIILVSTQGREPREIFPILGLFAFSSLRLMPSFNKLLVGFSSFRLGQSPINKIFLDLEKLDLSQPTSQQQLGRKRSEKLNYRQTLKAEHLTFTYPNAAGPAICDVSFSAPCGQSIGIVGASGAGKTTLADILLGLLSIDSGQLTLDDQPFDPTSPNWRNLVSYVPQEIFLIDDTLIRNIALGIPDDQIDEQRVAEVVMQANLADLVTSLPAQLNTGVGEGGYSLSGGQRQRIGIARALYTDPVVLVMDEATSALDAESEHYIMQAIEKLKGQKTIFLIAHRLSTIHKCEQLLYLEDGYLRDCGTFQEIRNRNAKFDQMVRFSEISNTSTDEIDLVQ